MTVHTSVSSDRFFGIAFLSVAITGSAAALAWLPRDRMTVVGIVIVIATSSLGLPAGRSLAQRTRTEIRWSRWLTFAVSIFLLAFATLIAILVADRIDKRIDLGIDLGTIVAWSEIALASYIGVMYLVAHQTLSRTHDDP